MYTALVTHQYVMQMEMENIICLNRRCGNDIDRNPNDGFGYLLYSFLFLFALQNSYRISYFTLLLIIDVDFLVYTLYIVQL